ncbi:hypothetical protein [Hymenobacter profundi]|uniref:Uncharacterized protein n=1 Tax=Hymenobacter profundi TaxID=1982110 RepID=A0ABS6WV40_9BACT|nr:hypothetical protein [Hymenobacter profundi]
MTSNQPFYFSVALPEGNYHVTLSDARAATAIASRRLLLEPLTIKPCKSSNFTKVNAQGQVEGVCVGTGMGFDPVFYYYRPMNVYAAHGSGQALRLFVCCSSIRSR